MNMNLDREAGTVTQGDMAIGKAVARLAGGFQTPGEAQVMNLRLGAPDMPVDELEAMLPSGFLQDRRPTCQSAVRSTDW